ncbi:uncharacterized protein [Spinacia oleracea]|uniref:CCHC-type domain-containing protein n=1 Tax=Spinacia oleracea TaxID=3562 RepID=A0ABM3R3W3_SPIOL|nr:uncharacterized protein LOC130465529 [Spinacia oleracea]
MEDYDFVMTQGPWMIGDSYLTIRKWVPNFVPDEAPIKALTAWVRIPNLSVEYFDRNFLFRIGEKIGKVVRIDKNTESMDRGQYIRLCIEVDLTKPLLSKFRLNGRIWKVQYEGLRLICFKCGHLGHKEGECTLFDKTEEGGKNQQETTKEGNDQESNSKPGGDAHSKLEEKGQYGSWMLVQKAPRRVLTKNKGVQNKTQQGQQSNKEAVNGPNGNNQNHKSQDNAKQNHRDQAPIGSNSGSRFEVLATGEVEDMALDQVDRNQTRQQSIGEESEQDQQGDTPNLGEDDIIIEGKGENEQGKSSEMQTDEALPTVDLENNGSH